MSGWTPERVAELTRLWADGWSASQIAQYMRGGLTRNAVIGKVCRLRLPGRSTLVKDTSRKEHPWRARPRRTKKRSPKPMQAEPTFKPEPYEPKQINFTPSVPVTFLELDNTHCRWIVGEPDGLNTLYCGERQTGESSYCWHHARIASDGIPVRKRKPKCEPVSSAEAWMEAAE